MRRILKFAAGGMGGLIAVIGLLVGAVYLLTPAPPEEPVAAGVRLSDVAVHQGRERRYLVYVPAALPPRPAIVFVLHGSALGIDRTRAIFGYGFERLAEQHGFLVVYPEGWGREWNGCRDGPGDEAHSIPIDDVDFLVGLADDLTRLYGADPDRLYAAGFSNGGQMAYRLATEAPHRFAAVAAIAAQQPADANSRCLSPVGRVSVLVMNGTEDPIVPYEGGVPSFYGWRPAGEVLGMAATLTHWRAVNGLNGAPEKSVVDGGPGGQRFEVEQWSGDGRAVMGVTVAGGGHGVPGGWQWSPAFIIGSVDRTLDAPGLIWSFFAGASASGFPRPTVD